jgi:hypothetical protein
VKGLQVHDCDPSFGGGSPKEFVAAGIDGGAPVEDHEVD